MIENLADVSLTRILMRMKKTKKMKKRKKMPKMKEMKAGQAGLLWRQSANHHPLLEEGKWGEENQWLNFRLFPFLQVLVYFHRFMVLGFRYSLL